MFKDTRRRFKQQLLQGVGAVEATNDNDFKDELAEYKGTCFAIKSLLKSMTHHLEAVRKMQESAAALTVELAAFNQSMDTEQSTVSLGEAMAEIERVQLASVERLYDEEVKAAAELLLWRVPEVEEKVKERKKLLLDYDVHLRRYESLSRAELSDIGFEPLEFGKNRTRHARCPSDISTVSRTSKKVSLFKKKKTNEEVAEELTSRKMRLENSEEAVDQSTKWLMEQFDDMTEKRTTGVILEGPMSALVACHLHLMHKSTERLEALAPHFGSVEIFLKTLNRYDQAPPVMQTIDVEGVAHMANMGQASIKSSLRTNKHSTKKNGIGTAELHATVKSSQLRTLDSSTLHVVHNCVSWIRANGLDTEGLFRIPGLQDTVNATLARYALGEKDVISSVEGITVHDVCTLLKQWLRNLKDSLIPAEHYKPLMDLLRQDLNLGMPATVTSVLNMMKTIPVQHQHVLAIIATLLNEIVSNEKINQMSVSNLAICIAPSLLRAPSDLEAAEVIADIQAAISACKVFILHSNKLEQPK